VPKFILMSKVLAKTKWCNFLGQSVYKAVYVSVRMFVCL